MTTELDLAELRRRLAGAQITDVAPLAGGASSLTFDGMRDGRKVVIKVAPPSVEPVAHRDVLRQARIIKALAGKRVPVPEVLWEDAGHPPHTPPLFVMSHVEGDCAEPLFDGVALDSADLTDRYRNACRTLAALHSIAPAALGLEGEPVVDPSAEVHRWCATLQTVDAALVPDWQDARDALLHCVPTALAPSVIHGDFRLGNLLAVGAGIKAIVDWEIWSVGDPRIDLSWFTFFTDEARHPGAPSSEPSGMPTADELLAAYRRNLPDLRWFDALTRYKEAGATALLIKRGRKNGDLSGPMARMIPALPGMLAEAEALLS